MPFGQIGAEIALGIGAQLAAADGPDHALLSQGAERLLVKPDQLGRGLGGDDGGAGEGRGEAGLGDGAQAGVGNFSGPAHPAASIRESTARVMGWAPLLGERGGETSNLSIHLERPLVLDKWTTQG